MRALMLLLIFGLSVLELRADESTESTRPEPAATDASEASEERPPVAAVEARDADDSFLPTDRLRHDQEVDFPTDI